MNYYKEPTLVNTAIEIILEECGWSYSPVEMSWKLGSFMWSRVNLHKAISQGKGKILREQVIEKLESSKEANDPNIIATIERLKTPLTKRT